MTRAQKKNTKKKQKRKDKKGPEEGAFEIEEVDFEVDQVSDSLQQLDLASSPNAATSMSKQASVEGATRGGVKAKGKTVSVATIETSKGAVSSSGAAKVVGRAEPTEKSAGSGHGEEVEEGCTSAEVQRKVRNLRKKLKQIEELEAKISSGEITKPEQGQLEKIAKKGDLMREIEELLSSS